MCSLGSYSLVLPAALLCAAAPEEAPFMADEAVLSVPGLGKLDYTLRHYLAYTGALREKVSQLNELGKQPRSIA